VRQREGVAAALGGERDQERHRRRGRYLPGAHRQGDALHAGPEADAGRRRPAELFDEAVVASSAADAALGAEQVGAELERRPRVVVEAADEAEVELGVEAHATQQVEHGVEVGPAVRTEVVADARRLVEHRAARLDLAVERAQRVQLEALATVATKLGLAAAQVVAEPADVGGPAGRVAHAVDRQAQAADAELREELGEHGDDLGVDLRRRRADRLGAQLVVLAVAAGLRPLVAEHRAVVPELHRLRPLVQAVLDVQAADRRRALGTQGQRTAALVRERVHLLTHDVGRLAHAALEQARLFELGGDDVPVPVGGEDPRRGRDHVITPGGLVGEQVVRPFRSPRAAHQW